MDLKTCKAEIDTLGVVSYRTRMTFMAAQGPATPDLTSRGHLFRAILSRLCAERTLPYWRDRFGEDEMTLGLRTCEAHLRGDATTENLNAFFLAAHLKAHDFPYEIIGTDDSTLCAGFGSVLAMSAHLHDFGFVDGDTENDVDTEDWDAAFCSAIAVAGGADWQAHETTLDIAARTAFWRWWADEAVPQAHDGADRFLRRSCA